MNGDAVHAPLVRGGRSAAESRAPLQSKLATGPRSVSVATKKKQQPGSMTAKLVIVMVRYSQHLPLPKRQF